MKINFCNNVLEAIIFKANIFDAFACLTKAWSEFIRVLQPILP